MSTEFDGFDDLAEGLHELRENVEEAESLIQPTLDQAVATTAARVERTAKQNITEQGAVDTGNLRSSIGYTRVELAHYLVGTPVEYAPYVERGTDPHVITANDDDGLLYFENQEGQLISKHSVQHPGTPAQPFLTPALIEHRSSLLQDIEDAIEELFREVFG
ncbi:MAG: HK97-gp10 family putative phage morphogenesis protein [Halobacteria archaeon]|nr:HK97-gp10 family putative phage morphogenesis protein [Halobacteria archaeon]